MLALFAQTAPTLLTPSSAAEVGPGPVASGELGWVGIGLIVVGSLVGLLFNFIPAMIAGMRGHRSTVAIALVCLFFGWTCVGWIIALVWAMADTGRDRRR